MTLDFIWNLLDVNWEKAFEQLKAYRKRKGHCRVPHGHQENNLKLGQWVLVQRRTRDKLSEERKHRLDDLGFVWDPYTVDWEEGLTNLKLYKNRVGHCRVPSTHRENGYRLGQWVNVQRGIRDKLSDDRRKKLDALGFVGIRE